MFGDFPDIEVIDFDHATLTWYENDKEISITIEALRYE